MRRFFCKLLMIHCLVGSLAYAQPEGEFATLKKGTLTVGTYFTNPPFEFIRGGKQVGFEVDLVQAIAKRLGLEAKFIATTWEGILDRLENNQYDTVVGGITITPEREKVLNFSMPYMDTTLSIMIDGQRNPNWKSIDDLKGKVIGAPSETTNQAAAERLLAAGKIARVAVYPFANIEEALSDLAAGRIDGYIKVFPVAYYFTQERKNIKILAQIPNDPQPLALVFNKNNPSLVAAVTRVLQEIEVDGTYTDIYQKWFKKKVF